MTKVTYLFGAGASCNSLPMVKQMPERLQGFIDQLILPDKKLSDIASFESRGLTKYSKWQLQEKLIEDLNWIHGNSVTHSSIDTFAKKLFIKKRMKTTRTS